MAGDEVILYQIQIRHMYSEVIDLSVGHQGEGRLDFPYYLLPLLVVHTRTPPPLPVVTSANAAPAIGQTASTTEFALEQDIASQVCSEFLNVHKQLDEQSKMKDEIVEQINLQKMAMGSFTETLQQHTNEFDTKLQDALMQQSNTFENRIQVCMQKQSEDTETKFVASRKETESNFQQMMAAFNNKMDNVVSQVSTLNHRFGESSSSNVRAKRDVIEVAARVEPPKNPKHRIGDKTLASGTQQQQNSVQQIS